MQTVFSSSITAGLLALGLALGIFAAPGAALAAPDPAPSLETQAIAAPKVVKAGYTGLTLGWPDYPKASKYEVRYGTRADFYGASMVEKASSRYLGDLANATTYYIQYRALVPGSGKYGKQREYTRSVWSATLKAHTLAAYPGAFSSVTGTGGLNSVTVDWNKTANTTKYSIVIADNMAMTLRPRSFTDITGTSFTIPDMTQGSRSSMPSYIRLYAHNKDFKTRNSARYIVYPAAPRVAGTENLSVASYNLLCAVCQVGSDSTPPWSKRIGKIMSTVKGKNPDVLLLQEALNVRVPGTNTKSMVNFQGRLKRSGYVLDRAPEKPGSPQYWNRIAYKSDKYALVRKGSFKMPTPPGQRQRGAVWLQLKSRATGKKFYALSYHIAPLLQLQGSNSKTAGMKKIHAKMKMLNPRNLPVVAGGDMNTHFYQLPSITPHEAMIRAGWTDVASSAVKQKFLYSTLNKYEQQQNKHFGRIDFIFTKNIKGTVSYKNVLDVDSSGVLRSVPGSDHNMVLARMKL